MSPACSATCIPECAHSYIYRPIWSSQVVHELKYTLLRLITLKGRTPDEAEAYVTRLTQQMRRAFPDAEVTGWERFMKDVHASDPNDSHVIAAALCGGAQVIITQDKRGFLTGMPNELRTQSPDDFLVDALDVAPGPVLKAVKTVSSRTGRNGPLLFTTGHRTTSREDRDP